MNRISAALSEAEACRKASACFRSVSRMTLTFHSNCKLVSGLTSAIRRYTTNNYPNSSQELSNAPASWFLPGQ
jgi:hypothetical protein